MAFKVAWDNNYNHPLPTNHRFPMRKYDVLPHRLVQEQIIDPSDLFSPTIVSNEVILACHTNEYLKSLLELTLPKKQQRESGFPLSKELIDREIRILSGTVDCAKYAHEDGIAINIAGGTHHAFSDRPEGFCLLNDQAVAAKYVLNENLSMQVLIIDLDVHQGNGTAEIFKNDPRVFTFSMHGSANYPFRKEVSDKDIALESGMMDSEYLTLLHCALEEIDQMIDVDFIFFQAGVDVLESDSLGKINLTMEGCKRRDEMVFEYAKSKSVPIVTCMGGGYSKDIELIIEAHCNTFISAKSIFQKT